MAKIWEQDKKYDTIFGYVLLMTRASFSKIIVEGKENIPQDKAIFFAPNHCCALMDPLLILQAAGFPIGFGARSDIFKNPKTGKLLRLLKILPIARIRNGLKEVASNYEIFEEIYECFDKNLPFCLFAEGTHNPSKVMLPMKKRSFVLCKEASEKLDKPIYIIPTAVDYEYFFSEGGRAAVSFAPPIEINEYFEKHKSEYEGEVYMQLCEDIRNIDLSMLDKLPQRKHNNLLLRSLLLILSLPLFAICAVVGLPIWLTARIILHGIEDKAWTHTVYFVLHFTLPVFTPFHKVFSVLLCKYKQLIEDFKK